MWKISKKPRNRDLIEVFGSPRYAINESNKIVIQVVKEQSGEFERLADQSIINNILVSVPTNVNENPNYDSLENLCKDLSIELKSLFGECASFATEVEVIIDRELLLAIEHSIDVSSYPFNIHYITIGRT